MRLLLSNRGFFRAAVAATAVAALLPTATMGGIVGDGEKRLRPISVTGVRAHQAALQAIADRNGGTRASGTPGYDQSVGYVVRKLRKAGYKVTVQPFDFALFEETAPPVLDQTEPVAVVFEPDGEAGFTTMEYSGSGDVTAQVQGIDLQLPPPAAPGSTSGCEAADFADFVPGNIALIQRGTCTFGEKAANAEAAGAAGVIIFNEGQAGRTELLAGTLSSPDFNIPVVGAAFVVGQQLATVEGVTLPTVHLSVTANVEVRSTSNVIADTRQGRGNHVVVVGAHLDSVDEGPGINDNGSGTAMILEIAEEMARQGIKPRNKVRFTFWGAEESGLLGSTHYVENLTEEEFGKIKLNLNFDMVGSPNFVRFIYDGDGSATGTAGPAGSDVIEAVFERYFDRKSLPTEPTAFDGRSDYGPFIAVGIPAGGLFTGAEEEKTPAQAAIFGGTAGAPLDPCYHQACDTFDNVNVPVLRQMTNASVHALMVFAMNRGLLCTPAESLAARSVETRLPYKGSRLVY